MRNIFLPVASKAARFWCKNPVPFRAFWIRTFCNFQRQISEVFCVPRLVYEKNAIFRGCIRMRTNVTFSRQKSGNFDMETGNLECLAFRRKKKLHCFSKMCDSLRHEVDPLHVRNQQKKMQIFSHQHHVISVARRNHIFRVWNVRKVRIFDAKEKHGLHARDAISSRQKAKAFDAANRNIYPAQKRAKKYKKNASQTSDFLSRRSQCFCVRNARKIKAICAKNMRFSKKLYVLNAGNSSFCRTKSRMFFYAKSLHLIA